MSNTLTTFCTNFKSIQNETYKVAQSKGWYVGDTEDSELLLGLHAEVAEVAEAIRHNNPPSDKMPAYSSVEEELADVIIRVMNFAQHKDLNVPGAILAKIEFNKTRNYRHGNKMF